MTITFVGHGYVGLVSASIFADLGNTVWVIGHTREKVENLKKGILPIYEPGLEEIVKRNVKAKRLLFTLDYEESIPFSEAVFIAVGTPPKPSGDADLSVVYEVAKKIGKYLDGYTVVVTKSTVPVGTNFEVKKIVEQEKSEKAEFDIASTPEFLREGQAISDTLHPDRIVIGTENQKAQDVMVKLHKSLDGEFVLTNVHTAEMIKYAANSFLATKISFANAIANLCENVDADAIKVLGGIGLDNRIGSSFLNPGPGYGGSCFPKDVKALIAIAKHHNYDFKLLKEVEAINVIAMQSIVVKAKKLLGKSLKDKVVGVCGLAFKPDTDDMRDAPSIVIIKELQKAGVKIKAFDPIAMEGAKRIFKDVVFCKDAYEVATGSDLLIMMTEWNEFRQLDIKKLKKLMRQPSIVDARNIYDPNQMREIGFNYIGVGR